MDSIPQKYCYKCKQTKPLEDFHNNRTRYDGKVSLCKECQRKYMADRHKRRPRTTKVMKLIGLSDHDYDEIWRLQEGKCALCGRPETSRNQWGTKKLATDHDHTTGKFRGLLCQTCNLKLAVLEDKEFVNTALAYLAKRGTAISMLVATSML